MKSKVIEVDFKRIKRHAQANRWSGLRIAREAKLSPSSVCFVLNGTIANPGATTLKRICDVIGLPIEQAFTQPKRRAA